MEKCISIIKNVLPENRMKKISNGKTEFVIMGTENKLKKVILMRLNLDK